MKNLLATLPHAGVLVIACAALPLASAHEGMHGEAASPVSISSGQHAFGRQGNPAKVDRTVVIDMDDKMRFAPASLRIKQGETIRFVVKNSGKILHEMVIGTMDALKEHHAMMTVNPDMKHGEPYMLHVPPGQQGTMIWQFTQAGKFHYACLIPGHFEAGMTGKIEVVKG